MNRRKSMSERKERLFNDGWMFQLVKDEEKYSEDRYVPVQLPHDWLIYDCQNLYADGTGYYKKYFVIDKKSKDAKRLKQYGKIVNKGSIKHKYLFLNSKYIYYQCIYYQCFYYFCPFFIAEQRAKYYKNSRRASC